MLKRKINNHKIDIFKFLFILIQILKEIIKKLFRQNMFQLVMGDSSVFMIYSLLEEVPY